MQSYIFSTDGARVLKSFGPFYFLVSLLVLSTPFPCFLCSSSSYHHLTLISESLPRVHCSSPGSLPFSSHISPVRFRFLFLCTRPDCHSALVPLFLLHLLYSPLFPFLFTSLITHYSLPRVSTLGNQCPLFASFSFS